VTSIEHGTYMDDEIFALMKKHGTWYVPTISAGKFVAEKAAVPGDPLSDISLTSKVSFVMKDGAVFLGPAAK
jgi:imidazolonepropionase-like amidohydrolase